MNIRTAGACLIIGLLAAPQRPARAQYKVEGWPVRKAWGSVKGNYVDPKTRELRMIFEDQAGTIRIVTIDPEAKTAVMVAEFARQ